MNAQMLSGHRVHGTGGNVLSAKLCNILCSLIVMGTQGYSNNGHTYFCKISGSMRVHNHRVGTEAHFPMAQ